MRGYSIGVMAVTPTSNPHRLRNVFLIGVGSGIVVALILGAIFGGGDKVSRRDIDRIDKRLSAIEQKLATPTPQPSVSASPKVALTVGQINKDPKSFTDQTVELTGKVSSPHQGVGFVLQDTDGTFLWVHTHDKIPTGNASVKGKITELKDQLSQWKNEPGWPDNDSALTAKLRDEKVFVEAENVT